MKLSKKEMSMVVILLILVLGFVYFQYVYTPLLLQIDQKRMEKEQKVQMVSTQKQKIENRGNLELRLKKLKEEMQPLVDDYYGDVDQEEFIVLLNQFAEKSKLNLRRLEFTESEAMFTVPTSHAEEAGNSEGEGLEPEIPAEAASTEDASTGDTSVALGNIELLSARTEFEGDYAQFRSLLANMDDNPQRIISATLRLEKEGEESESGSQIRGDIVLDFYKIKDVEKYLTAPTESVLAMPYVEKSHKPTPVDAYGWASILKVTDVPPVRLGIGSSGTLQTIPGTTIPVVGKDTPIVPKSQIPASKDARKAPQLQSASLPKATPAKEVLPAVSGSITEFKTVDGVEIGKGTTNAYATILHQSSEGSRYKGGALLNYAFVEKGKGIVDMNLMDKNLILSQKPKNIDFEFYAQVGSGHKLIVVFKDADNKDYIVHLSENINFSGWKTFELGETYIPEMNYPVRIKSFLVENNPGATQGASVLFGGISAAY